MTRAGLFVKLAKSGADEFVPAATLGTDYFRYEEGLHALIGNRTGETHRLGDLVEVKLIEAAPFAGALRFELLSEGRRGRARPIGKAGKPPHRDTKPAGASPAPGSSFRGKTIRKRERDRR